MAALNLITALNLILFFVLFFFRKNNVLPNKILAFILVNPAISFIGNASILTGYIYEFPYYIFFVQANAFLFSPLVYIYINMLMNKKNRWNNPLYIATGISMLLVGYFALEYGLMTKNEQLNYLARFVHEPYPTQMIILSTVFIILQQIYFTASAIQVYNYRKSISNTLANFDKTRVKFITSFIILIWTLNVVSLVLYSILPTMEVEYLYLPIVLTIIYFFIMYFVAHYNSVFTIESYQIFVTENTTPIAIETPTVKNNLHDPDTIRAIASQIEDYLKNNEPFVNPDLTLEVLSKSMNLSPSKVSAAINSILGKTFYDLINEQRVEKSKILLKSKTNYTIEAIAFESGFNSRASFYRAFKKYTGETPSDFVKS